MVHKVLVAGSLHHDVVVNAPRLPGLDETLAGSHVAYVAGGKGGNQAVAASRHGAAVAFAGRIGNDAAGQLMVAHLEGAQIDLSNLQRGLGSTGMSVAIVNEAGDYGAVIVSGANLDIDPDAIAIPRAPASWCCRTRSPRASTGCSPNGPRLRHPRGAQCRARPR